MTETEVGRETTHEDDCVARGARLLDDHRPGWRESVDAARLDVSDFHSCVLGQLYGSFSAGLTQLGLRLDGARIEEHGFDVLLGDTGRYPAVQGAWERVLLDPARRVGEL